MTESNDGENRPTGCCVRIRTDFSTPLFGVEDTNGRTLDLDRSFCTTKSWGIVGLKLTLWGVVASVLIQGWMTRIYPHYFLAYVSNWTLVFSVIYMSLSLLTSSCCGSTVCIKLTWAAYSVAVVHSIVIVIMYWLTVYEPGVSELSYYSIMCHSGTFAIVLFDGMVTNKVPVRLKHFIFNFIMNIIYLAWNLLQAYVPVDNPYQDQEIEYIYTIFQWKEHTTSAIIVTVLLLFVIFPMFHTLFWALSLCGRRYIVGKGEDAVDEEHGPEHPVAKPY